MDETFVGIHHLLEVERLVAVVGEGGIAVKVLIGLNDLIGIGLGTDDLRTEDATGEVATIGDEVDICIEIALYLLQTLTNLGNVLMLEGLIVLRLLLRQEKWVVAPGF